MLGIMSLTEPYFALERSCALTVSTDDIHFEKDSVNMKA